MKKIINKQNLLLGNKLKLIFSNKDWLWFGMYLIVSLIFIWFLTKLWIPEGFSVVGHDSGLALNTEDFLKTRFFAWDDRVDFGIDNSPHFGSIVLHYLDYIISFFAKVPYAGSQLAVFLWIGGIFVFSFIFSHSLVKIFGKYFAFLFPIFLTFNFYIFQSIFILERAKYELIFSTLIFLTLVFKIFLKDKPNVLKYSILFSLIITIFNGGGWFGLPLYGGLFVISLVILMFSLAFGIKEKNYLTFKRMLLFYLLNIIFFILLNAYSIFPYFVTLINSDYAKVISQGSISAGYEWLSYISRGSSFLNLFKLQGIPDWYLTGYGANPDHAYASIYLSNAKFIFFSFLIPIIALLGLLFKQKEKIVKYIISFFIILLIVSMFFVSGTNSPLGFIYEYLYTKIPGFNIFRSPYYKFAPAYLIAFSFLLSYSLSKIIFLVDKIKLLKLIVFILIIIGWFSYHKIIFNSKYLFIWQPEKSTLVQIPDYVNEFGNWINSNNIEGRVLVVPPSDKTWRDDSYEWGYWSLSTLPSLLLNNADFITNDININSGEEGWVDELYLTLLLKDKNNFVNVSNRLGVKYLFLKEDYSTKNKEQGKYLTSINWFLDNGHISLIKKIGDWSLLSINSVETKNMFKLTENLYSIPNAQQYFESQIHDNNYDNASWVDIKYSNENVKKIIKKKIFPLNCESCQIENLGKHAEIPVVRILPNSPFYQIKQQRNNNIINEAKDDQARIGAYLGLIMIKYSEIRSMYELKIEKEFINEGLEDIIFYLQAVKDIVTKSPDDKVNFYLASKIYETLNPLQRFFRDYINSSDYNFEKSFIKDNILKVLWEGVTLKKLFDPVIEQEDRWNYEKYYDLSNFSDSEYSLLIDTQTLPVDLEGIKINPDKIIIDSNNEFKLKGTLNGGRFLTTTTELVSNASGVRLYFSNLPDLFKRNEGKKIDFPEGTRGCITGEINNFNKFRAYRFQISSTKDVDNLRFYIKEGTNNISNTGFLRGDIEVDINAGRDQKSFEYIYVPNTNSTKPQVFLCRYDESIPQVANIKVKEIFSPIVYAVNDISVLNNNPQSISYNKINPTKYEISMASLDRDYILIFNSRYNDLWELYSSDTKKVITNHFMVDGYANGWLVTKGDGLDFELIYKPQVWYEKGKIVSLIFLLIIITAFGYNNYLGKINKYD